MQQAMTFPEADKQWEHQWVRITRDWGSPKPARAMMNGLDSEGLLKWMNSLQSKGELESAKATGDGYWECRVHWRDLRIIELQEARNSLSVEQFEQRGHKLQRRPLAGSVAPLPYPPLRSKLPLNAGIVRASPPPPVKELDLSEFSISQEEDEEGKKQGSEKPLVDYTPPPSPSDVSFTVSLN